MKRKLFSVMLCTLALLLLMGAGVEPDSSAALVIEEESTSMAQQEQVLETGEPTGTEESVEAQPQEGEEKIAEETVENEETEAADQTGDAAETQQPAPTVDEKFLVNGQPAEQQIYRMLIDGVTYVAVSPAVRAIDPTAQVTWDGATGTASIRNANLNMTVKVGQNYAMANGRCLYVEGGILKQGDNMLVPLRLLTKAFDAQLSWDAATETISVVRGSGALVNGDQYYNQEDLFWLSRVIHAESGNQSLKGKMAVGNVVMNRVESHIFPNSIVGVLSQRNQFTTWRGGKLANRTPNEGSVIAAKLVLEGAVVEESEGALFFDSLKSSWASRTKTYVCTIGGHKFYR